MKFKFLIFICCLTVQAFALSAPQPIRGTPNICSKSFNLQAGATIYKLTPPPGWGIGETSSSENVANFTLFPQKGGNGCTIQVNQFETEALASAEVERLRSTFSSTKSLLNGFESELKNAWYASYTNENYVAQIWYVVPKKSNENRVHWENLKHSISIEKEKRKTTEINGIDMEEVPHKGWVFNHPEDKLYVMFKNDFINPSKPCQDPDKAYLLSIGDMDSSGYFYLKWNSEDPDTRAPYDKHLDELKADVLKLEPNQTFEKNSVYVEEEQWAFLRGSPYTIISLSGDGFLFGFALKNKGWRNTFDLNKYLKRVEWWLN